MLVNFENMVPNCQTDRTIHDMFWLHAQRSPAVLVSSRTALGAPVLAYPVRSLLAVHTT